MSIQRKPRKNNNQALSKSITSIRKNKNTHIDQHNSQCFHGQSPKQQNHRQNVKSITFNIKSNSHTTHMLLAPHPTRSISMKEHFHKPLTRYPLSHTNPFLFNPIHQSHSPPKPDLATNTESINIEWDHRQKSMKPKPKTKSILKECARGIMQCRWRMSSRWYLLV